MLKGLVILMMSISFMYASAEAAGAIPDITMTWAGFAALIIFVVGYYFIANEVKYHIDKSVQALFIGIFTFLMIAVYYGLNDLNIHLVHDEAERVILEIAEIFFFLFVAVETENILPPIRCFFLGILFSGLVFLSLNLVISPYLQ